MALFLLAAAIAAATPPPVDWDYFFVRTDHPAIVGEEASALGSQALGQIGRNTVRIERSHYGIALYDTLSFYQKPRVFSRTCEQVVYQAEAIRTRSWTPGLSPKDQLRAEASGDGHILDRLSIWRQFSRADAKGDCPEDDKRTRAKDRSDFDTVMYALEQVRADEPAPAVAAFLREPIVVVQRVGSVMTAEGYTKRLIIWLRSGGRVDTVQLEDKPPPPLS